MRDSAANLSAFVFPVVAWAPQLATGDPTDPGIREFRTPAEVTTTYLPESDLRLGWTFVDLEGRCWEAVSSSVVGGAYPWWARLTRGWIWDRRYRLVVEFVERPPMPFEAVKSRLFEAVKANPQFYCFDRRGRLQQLRDAESLRDLIRTEEELEADREARAIERLRPEPLWWQWLFGDGRCSRRSFVVAAAASLALGWLGIAWINREALAVLVGFLVLTAGLLLGLSATVRRLHDMRRSGWWILAGFAWTWIFAAAHDLAAQGSLLSAVAGLVWPISALGILGFLAVWPGTQGPNRYGLARRGRAGGRAEAT